MKGIKTPQQMHFPLHMQRPFPSPVHGADISHQHSHLDNAWNIYLFQAWCCLGCENLYCPWSLHWHTSSEVRSLQVFSYSHDQCRRTLKEEKYWSAEIKAKLLFLFLSAQGLGERKASISLTGVVAVPQWSLATLSQLGQFLNGWSIPYWQCLLKEPNGERSPNVSV